jgi:ribosome recycling factor
MSNETALYEDKMKKSIAALQSELDTIRVGRANPHVLDKLMVSYYGVDTPLQQVASVTVPEARTLVIQPWEQNMVKVVEKAILSSDLGITPSSDGKIIRLTFPELTEDRRKTVSKDVKKKGDDCKVAIRNIRRDAVDHFKKQEKKGEVTEDALKDLEDKVQKLTDKKIDEIDKVVEAKNKEVLSL